jgi:uncharacterized protein (TIGR02145 family)
MPDPFNKIAFYFIIGISVLLQYSCDYETGPVAGNNHQLLFPNMGETLVDGYTYKITWSDDLSTTMRIRLIRSGEVHVKIAERASNTGEFEWIPPDTFRVDHDYSIRVMSNDDDFIYYESEKPFKILKSSDTASFTDPRDGQVYKIVKLYNRWWMAQNFNYDTLGSFCYGNNNANCEKHGRLYTISSAKSACPPGWRLPTDNDWRSLEAYLGITNNEIYNTGFRGVNAGSILRGEEGVGFNIKYSGYLVRRYSDRYYSLNQSAHFWTSSYKTNDSKYWIRQLTNTSAGIERTTISAANHALSVRYVKDLN